MDIQTEFDLKGFAVIPSVYTSEELGSLKSILNAYCSKQEQAVPVHAIRRTLEKIPELNSVLWNDNLKSALSKIAGSDFFLTKAIYFDKSEQSNWFVAYHQDLSISVKKQHDLEGYKNWTFKDGQIGVQPPPSILENIITFRIHLDDTDESNGALRLITGSHKTGVKRIKDISINNEEICSVSEGGLMLMKPLTFHASSRSTQQKRRRVLHLEFSNQQLAEPLQWREKLFI